VHEGPADPAALVLGQHADGAEADGARAPVERPCGAGHVAGNRAACALGHERQGGDPAGIGPQRPHEPDLDRLGPGLGAGREGGAVHGIHGIGVGRDLTADQHLPIIAAAP